MKKWKTTLHLKHENGTMKSKKININSGIFKGDSLSALLFCLALAPLTTLLNSTKPGYVIKKRKVYHLFYMDDVKEYAMNDEQLKKLRDIVKIFSDDRWNLDWINARKQLSSRVNRQKHLILFSIKTPP